MREQGGAPMKIGGHGGQPGSDHPSEITGPLACLRASFPLQCESGSWQADDIEGDGRAKVDDDCRRPGVGVHGHRVGKTICPDLLGVGVVDANGELALVGNEMHWFGGEHLAKERGLFWHHGGHHDGIEFELGAEMSDLLGFEVLGGNALKMGLQARRGPERELRAGVRIVDEEQAHR